MTSVQRLAFASSDLVYHREMCPPTAHCSTSGDHLLGLVSVVVCPGGCLVIVQQPAAPGAGPGVIPACSMQPASRPEASWPSQLAPSTSPPIGSRGWSVPIHASSHLPQLPYYFLCPLLVSLGSAPGSQVARPRRNTATLASPPWLLVHGQWLMSFGLGGDKKPYAIAAMRRAQGQHTANSSLLRTLPAG